MVTRDTLDNHFFSQRETHRYLERFYEKKTKKRCNILLGYTGTSFIRMKSGRNEIVISAFNLSEFYSKAPHYYKKLLYSVITHEFAHAVYTGDKLPYSDTLNIIEDMRIEYQTEKWNKKARFDVMRYILQDKNIKANEIDNITTLGLALFRTVNNKPYIEYLKAMDIDPTKVLIMGEKYRSIPHELGVSNRKGTKKYNEILKLADEIEKELRKLLNQQKEVEEKKKKKAKKILTSIGGKETKQTQKIEESLINLQSSKDLTTTIEERLKNPKTTSYKPPFYKTEIADTIRRSGIKGSGQRKTRAGTMKTFNTKSYMRRKHTKENKHFDTLDYESRGGKSTKLTIYLDVSNSMNSYVDNSGNMTSLKIAVDYIANLYDQSHKNIDIKLRTFGTAPRIITRNELDPKFLSKKTQEATLLYPQKIKKDELAIVITDGIFHNQDTIPNDFLRKAHFIMIDVFKTNLYAKNKYFIDAKELNQTMDKVTKKIKEAFKNAR